MENFELENFLAENHFIGASQQDSLGDFIQKAAEFEESKIMINQGDYLVILSDQKSVLKFAKDWQKDIGEDDDLKNLLSEYLRENPNQIYIDAESSVKKKLFNKIDSFLQGFDLSRSEIDNIVDATYSEFKFIVTECEDNSSEGGDKKNWTILDEDIDDGHHADLDKGKTDYYLNIECPTTIAKETEFTVSIRILAQQITQWGGPITVEEGWEIEVLLNVISGLDLSGLSAKTIIFGSDNQDELDFVLKSRQEREGKFSVTAIYKDQIIFKDKYIIDVEENSSPFFLTDTHSNRIQKPVEKDASADLTLLINEHYEQGRFKLLYHLYSPKKELGLKYVFFESPMLRATDPGKYFLDFFNDLERLPIDPRLSEARLRGKGIGLFKALFPKEMRTKLWEIKDLIQTVAIRSEEPWIPWEMCFISNDGANIIDEGFFLCENYNVARWINDSNVAPTIFEPVNAALVFPHVGLDHIEKEKAEIKNVLNQKLKAKITDIRPNSLSVLEDMQSDKYSIWHFSGHGTNNDNANPDYYSIILDDDETLTPDDINGFNLVNKMPIIFLNACQVGGSGNSLTGVGGWPKQFIENRAGAFIGALWSISDKSAKNFAIKFYQEFAAGQTIGESFKLARKEARKDGNATWLAYVLYANPNAKIIPHEQI